MKHFFKVFSIALICFMLAAGAFALTYVKANEGQANNDNSEDTEIEVKDTSQKEDENKEEPIDPLQKAIEDSERLNILLLGLEGPRTDTIMFASFDPKTKKVDMISIPRDTYFHRAGYDAKDERKINAVYGDAGVKGTMGAVKNILGGVPVHHYVKVTYSGVNKIVDSLGGVEVDVPFHMHYEDPYDKPPLVIDIPEGRQTLRGEQAIQFLRFRKGNDGEPGYPDGDIGRIKAQQKFIKSAINKSLSYRLPIVAATVLKYVKTDMLSADVLLSVNDALGIKLDDITITTLPGRSQYIDGVSYFIHDPAKVEEMIMKMYNVKEETTDSN